MIDRSVLAVLNHLLNQAGWARQRLAPFAGQQARLSMPPWRVCLRITEDGWFGAATDDAADVEIALPAETPFLALQGIGKVVQAARVEGSAQFAGELGDVLKNLRWDYEEDLSRLFGDIAAHRLAGGIAAVGDWQKRSAGRFVAAFVSGMLEKNALLVRRSEQRDFSADVAALAAALGRDERRLAALAAQRGVGR